MRNRLLSLIAASAIIASACSATATTSPSTSTGSAPPATPEVTVPPIPDVTLTSYKADPVGNKGGNLVIGISGDPTTVWTNTYDTFANDQDAFGPALWGLWNNTMDLKYYGQLAADVPTIANKEVVVTGDKMDLTINLVAGAQWSDGQPINCDDVIYQWHWQMDPGQAASGNVNGTTGWELITAIDGAGTSTCVVHFSKVYEQYLGLWSPLFPAHYLKTASAADAIKNLYKDTDLTSAVWSGPYMPTKWAHDAQINYIPNPKFWSTIKKSDAPFDAVSMKFYTDNTALIAGFANNEVDTAIEFNQNDVASMSAVDPTQIVKVPSVTYEQNSWNYADLVKKFGDAGAKTFMEAMHYAYDKDAINQTITGGVVTPTCSFTNSQAWFFDPSVACYTHDATKAASILAAGGFTKDASGTLIAPNGTKADLIACARADRQYRIDTLNLVASQLKPLGINTTVKVATAATLFGGWGTTAADTPCNLTHGNYDYTEFAWVSTPDPVSIYLLYISTADPSVGDHSGQNYIRVNNPDLDTLLKEIQSTVDLLKIKDDMSKIQKLYIDPANAFPEIPLYDWTTVLLKNPKLHNVQDNGSASVQTWNLEDWWREP